MYDNFEKFLEYDDILEAADTKLIQENAKKIHKALTSLGLTATYVTHAASPTVTTYKFEPYPRINIKKFESAKLNIQMVLEVESVRILAPVPMEKYVGVEVSNTKRHIVRIRGIIDRLVENGQWHGFDLPLVLGIDTSNNDHCIDLAKAPHLLVAGATGTGKSVFINTCITSLLLRQPPELLRLVLIDPKMVEMSFYKGIPHLYCDIVTETERAIEQLNALVDEMEYRYKILEAKRYRNLIDYNAGESEQIPFIVCIIDECADLIMAFPKKERHLFETPVARIAQKARAVGIHLIIATQRPSADVITGLIKANFPTRICFDVSSSRDSMVVMDVGGVEDLIGKGDMFFKCSARTDLVRIQGTFLTDDEIWQIVQHWISLGPKDIHDDLHDKKRIVSLCGIVKALLEHSPTSLSNPEKNLRQAVETYLSYKSKNSEEESSLETVSLGEIDFLD